VVEEVAVMGTDVLSALGVVGLFVALGLWNRSRSRVVVRGPRVLVLNLNSDAALAATDAGEYRTRFSDVTESATLDALHDQQFDVIHVLARVAAEGNVGTHSSRDFQRAVAAAKPKLVILASDTPGEAYMGAFRGSECPYNLVLTISRRGTRFWGFFQQLFELMFRGHPMPQAWVKLAPQVPGMEHPDLPAMICQMGAGQLVFHHERAVA
jgi:hypothetical protein